MRRFLTFALVLFMAPIAAFAQNATLADIRQQLSVLYSDINVLKGELTTSGTLTNGAAGNTPLDRLNAIEIALQRLTSKTEELEFRVNRITVDGTNRIGDLEFRLCELETGCDIGQLGETPSLGGVDNGATVTQPDMTAAGPALAIGEQADFSRAQEAFAQRDFRSAADLLATFSATYPGSPVSQQAELLRGKALDGLGDTTGAARAYLDAFSGNPQGTHAPEALLKLGVALGAVGQIQDGCITLAEVAVRFPRDPNVLESQSAMRNLGCS